MKNAKIKIYFIVAIASILSVNFSYGQDTLTNQKKTFLIKFSPFLFLNGDYVTNSFALPLEIEFAVNEKLAFNYGIAYITGSGDYNCLLPFKVKTISGVRIDNEIKQYLKNSLTGYYLSAHFLYQYTDASLSYGKVYRNLFALHGKIGWQLISKKGFVFDVAIGIRYDYSKSNILNVSDIDQWNLFYWYKKPYEYGNKWFFSVNSSGWII